MTLERLANRLFYKAPWWRWLVYPILVPLSYLFRSLVWLRRRLYQLGVLRQHKVDVPVIVVGNITLGGTGKTSLVIWLANQLTQRGLSVGVITRGYRAAGRIDVPTLVTNDSDVKAVGDEALLIARKTQASVWVGAKRALSAEACAQVGVDVIISDDGLQHYALARDIEIAVIDGARGLGNGFCLPAGPLRESITRLNEVDCIVSKGEHSHSVFTFAYEQDTVRSIADDSECLLIDFRDQAVNLVAGIGHPEQFFDPLVNSLTNYQCYPFADHHCFHESDFAHIEGAIIMTEKDAMKCRQLSHDDLWYVPTTIQFNEDMIPFIDTLVTSLKKQLS